MAVLPGQTLRGRAASAGEVQDLRAQIQSGIPRSGELARHWQEVKSLKPEVAQLDLMSFKTTITAAGDITQPDKQSTPAGYYAELFKISGYMQNPATDPELQPTVFFNVKDESRAGNKLFTTDIEFAYITSTTGQGEGICFPRGLYVFDPGVRLSVPITIDTDGTLGYANLASETKYWGVLLHFNLYAF